LAAFGGRKKRNVAVVGLALLLSCCTSKPTDDLEYTDADRQMFACRQYGFYPGTKQFDECMKYVARKGPL
jgi:PBP1b-binding outer membrane lipoprotein LpoB